MLNNKMKKGVVGVVAGSMVLGSMVIPAAAADSYTATGIFTDSTWGWATWGTIAHNGDATVTGDGTYTVTINANDLEDSGAAVDKTGTASADAMVFCIDIPDLATALTDAGLTSTNCSKDVGAGTYKCLDSSLDPDVKVSDVKVSVDGTSVSVDQSKVLYGDIEDKGIFRIELCNAYGGTYANNDASACPIDPTAIKCSEKIEVTFTLSGTGMGDTAASDDDTDAADDTDTADDADDADDTEATATATATAAADSTKTTGDVSLGIVYGALIVCAGGLVVVNLRRKQNMNK